MIPAVVVHCGLGAFFAVLSLPLALRVVPMNRWYGIRIPKAYESEENWYEINAYGGKLLLVYGLALVAFGYLARDAAPPPSSPWRAVYVAGPLILVFPVLALIIYFARRLP